MTICHPCRQLSTYHGDNTILSASPWAWPVHKNIFQYMIDQILNQCESVIGIADDVDIHGRADEDHDRHLHNMIGVASEHGFVFEGESVLSNNHLWPSDGSVTRMEHILNLLRLLQCTSPPHMPTQLHMFLGTVTYLSPYLQSLSFFTMPVHKMLKKGTEFTWNESHMKTFGTRKYLVYPKILWCL